MITIKEVILDIIIETLELSKQNLELGRDQWIAETDAIIVKAETAIKSGRAV